VKTKMNKEGARKREWGSTGIAMTKRQVGERKREGNSKKKQKRKCKGHSPQAHEELVGSGLKFLLPYSSLYSLQTANPLSRNLREKSRRSRTSTRSSVVSDMPNISAYTVYTNSWRGPGRSEH